MRVTSNTFPNRLLTQLGDLAARQTRLQSQAATGQRVQLPEDDPSAMRRVLELQAEAGSNDQYVANIARLKETTTAAYSSMKALKTLNDRAGEIIISAGGLTSDLDLDNLAHEINDKLESAVNAANAKYNGD
jgi:flagellar hook-associated protein 3 FlgL